MRLGAFLALAVLVGCTGDEEEHEVGPVCTELGEICHEAGEAGVEGAEECHEVGHAGDEAACEAELESCTAICAPDDTGA